MRYIQAELLRFAESKGETVDPTNFALDKITESATTPPTPKPDPKPKVSEPEPLPDATN